ncbi:unnamed protein product [Lepidochelys olivacea]
MWVALPLCLLSALLATGSALQCEVCESKEQSCSGSLQPCAPSEGTCITVVAEFRLEGSSLSYTAKSCLEPKNCEPGPFSLTYAYNVTVWANIACCDTDGCNAEAIPVPTVSSVPNGRQCPSCFNLWGGNCQDNKPLACTGAEDHCVEESGILTLGVPLHPIPPLQRIYHSSQFSIIRKFAESAIHTILQIIYEDIEQNRPQDQPLGHST